MRARRRIWRNIQARSSSLAANSSGFAVRSHNSVTRHHVRLDSSCFPEGLLGASNTLAFVRPVATN